MLWFDDAHCIESINKSSEPLHAQNLHGHRKSKQPKVHNLYETRLNLGKNAGVVFFLMHLQVSARSGLDSFSAVFVKFRKGMRNNCRLLGFGTLRAHMAHKALQITVLYTHVLCSFNHHPPRLPGPLPLSFRKTTSRSSNIQYLPALQRHLSSNPLYRPIPQSTGPSDLADSSLNQHLSPLEFWFGFSREFRIDHIQCSLEYIEISKKVVIALLKPGLRAQNKSP